MNEESLKNEIARLKNLPQYKNKSDEEVAQIIQEREEEIKDTDLAVEEMFTDREEKKLAKELLKKYLRDYVIEKTSDKNTLKSLIYLEVLQVNRLQKTANEEAKETGTVDSRTLYNIHKNLEQISELKEKLGLTKSKMDEMRSDPLKYLELLKKKFENHRKEHQASYIRKCPHCGKWIHFMMRMEAWEAKKFKFFKDNILGNRHLIFLYKTGKLLKDDLAKIFGTSKDYIDWLVTKWTVNVQEEEKTINEVVEEAKKELESGEVE